MMSRMLRAAWRSSVRGGAQAAQQHGCVAAAPIAAVGIDALRRPRAAAAAATRRGDDDAVFAEWLAANPLPGTAAALSTTTAAAAAAGGERRASGGGGSASSSDLPPDRTVPLSANGPKLLRCMAALHARCCCVDAAAGGGTGMQAGTAALRWQPDSHAWVAWDAAAGGGGGRVLAELRLPRVVPPPRAPAPDLRGDSSSGDSAPTLEAHMRELTRRPGGGGGDDEDGLPLPGWDAGGERGSPYSLDWLGGSGSGGGAHNDDAEDDGDSSDDDLDADERALLAEEAAAAALDFDDDGAPLPVTGSVLLVLLSADSAALGLWRGGALARHKVLKGYTVRRKQGGAQDAFERGGGGRPTVGSALRRRETARLWHRAAARLAAWRADVAGCHSLFRSGGVRCWNLLYAADPPPPVGRRDARWRPLGEGVRRPRFRDLVAAHRALSRGELRLYGEFADGCWPGDDDYAAAASELRY